MLHGPADDVTTMKLHGKPQPALTDHHKLLMPGDLYRGKILR